MFVLSFSSRLSSRFRMLPPSFWLNSALVFLFFSRFSMQPPSTLIRSNESARNWWNEQSRMGGNKPSGTSTQLERDRHRVGLLLRSRFDRHVRARLHGHALYRIGLWRRGLGPIAHGENAAECPSRGTRQQRCLRLG